MALVFARVDLNARSANFVQIPINMDRNVTKVSIPLSEDKGRRSCLGAMQIQTQHGVSDPNPMESGFCPGIGIFAQTSHCILLQLQKAMLGRYRYPSECHRYAVVVTI